MATCEGLGLMIDPKKSDWFTPPLMAREPLRDLKKCIDGNFREFSRNWGEWLESVFWPLRMFLNWFEDLLLATPWPLLLLIFAALAYLGSRSWKMSVGTALAFLFIGYLDMWEDTMATVAMVSVATFVCIAVGIPLGIWMSRSDRVEAFIVPILDIICLLYTSPSPRDA